MGGGIIATVLSSLFPGLAADMRGAGEKMGTMFGTSNTGGTIGAVALANDMGVGRSLYNVGYAAGSKNPEVAASEIDRGTSEGPARDFESIQSQLMDSLRGATSLAGAARGRPDEVTKVGDIRGELERSIGINRGTAAPAPTPFGFDSKSLSPGNPFGVFGLDAPDPAPAVTGGEFDLSLDLGSFDFDPSGGFDVPTPDTDAAAEVEAAGIDVGTFGADGGTVSFMGMKK